MLFRRPFVDTSPPALLVAVLWFSHCLLRPKSSSVIGTWSSRARVFFTSWAACDGHVPYILPYLVALGGFWCSIAVGDLLSTARVLHAPSSVVLLPIAESVLDVFQFVFNRMYLIVCFGLDLAWSLRLSTDCDRLHSASRGSYLNAEAHFCWLGLFVPTINMFWVLG